MTSNSSAGRALIAGFGASVSPPCCLPPVPCACRVPSLLLSSSAIVTEQRPATMSARRSRINAPG